MAQQQDTASQRVSAPILRWPREEAVVNGAAVHFVWEPLPEEGAAYTLQVATDTTFSELVVDEDLGDTSEVRVRDVFATDERTYFWRVLATDAEGKTHGYDTVESFIGGTEEDAVAHPPLPNQAERLGPLPELITGEGKDLLYVRTGNVGSEEDTPVRPDQEEDLGPVAELVKAAAIEVAADVTDAEKYYQAEEEMGVEHEGIEAKQIMAVALTTIVVLVVIIITLFQLTDRAARSAYDAAVTQAQYPELRQAEAEAARLLSQYEVVNDQEQVYRIPVDRAIDLMVNEAYQETGRTYSSELQLRPGN